LRRRLVEFWHESIEIAAIGVCPKEGTDFVPEELFCFSYQRGDPERKTRPAAINRYGANAELGVSSAGSR